MRLELKLRSHWLRTRVLGELRRVVLCVSETLGNGDFVVERIELAEAATFSRNPDTTISVATQQGGSVVPGAYHVLMHQPVWVRLVGLSALEASNKAPSVPFNAELQLVLRLRFGVAPGGEARFRIEYVTTNLGALAQLLSDPEAIAQRIDTAAQSAGGTPWTPLPLESLATAFGQTMVATNLGLALSSEGGEMLVFRLEINGPFDDSLAHWTSFYEDAFPLDLPADLDWQILVHRRLFLGAFRRRTRDGLEAAEAEGAFRPSPGLPSVHWHPETPFVQIAYSGEVPDACTAVIVVVPVPVDVDVDVVTDILFSVPAPNQLRVTLRAYWDVDDLEVFACAVSAVLFWPVVAVHTLFEGNSVRCDGSQCIDLVMTGTFLSPIAIFIGILAVAESLQPEGLSFEGFDQVEDTDADLELRQNFTGFDLPLGMELTEVRGNSEGLLLGGTLPLPATVSHPAELEILGASESFRWHFVDVCGDSPTFTASAFINFRNALFQHPNHTPLELCRIEVLDDPDLRYTPFLEVRTEAGGEQGSIRFDIPHSNAQATAPGYPCKVLILSNGGARILTIEGYDGVSQQELDEYLVLVEVWQSVHCKLWADIRSSRFYDPAWDIDPPPFETGFQEILTISTHRALPRSILTATDSNGQILAQATVDPEGRASFEVAGHNHGSPAQLSIQVSNQSGFRATSAETPIPRQKGGDEGLGKLGIFKQSFSLERVLTETKLSDVSLGRWGKRRLLFALADHELLILDLDQPGSAKLVARTPSASATGFVPIRGGGVLWGAQGSSLVALDPESGSARPITRRPVLSAACLRSHVVLLEERQILVIDGDGEIRHRMRLGSPRLLVASGGHLVVAQKRTLCLLELTRDAEPKIQARARVGPIAALDGLHTLDGDPAVLVTEERRTRAVRFSSRGLVDLARYDVVSPLCTAVRLGTLRSYVHPEAGAVLARTYGGRSLNESEILNAEKIDTSDLPIAPEL